MPCKSLKIRPLQICQGSGVGSIPIGRSIPSLAGLLSFRALVSLTKPQHFAIASREARKQPIFRDAIQVLMANRDGLNRLLQSDLLMKRQIQRGPSGHCGVAAGNKFPGIGCFIEDSETIATNWDRHYL
jgi:hypothetical protein